MIVAWVIWHRTVTDRQRDGIDHSQYSALHMLTRCNNYVEQEAQLPQRNSASAAHMEGAKPSSPLASPSGYTYAYGRIRNPQQTYAKRAVLKAHFKLNRAFKVIQGYPYLCRQEPRAVYCRNVQLMPPLFPKLNLRRYGNRNTANSSISTTPLKFEDVPARNAFEYLQMIYIARN